MEEVAPNVQNKSGRKIKVKTNTFVLTAILLTANHAEASSKLRAYKHLRQE
jgi:hypothetical protein